LRCIEPGYSSRNVSTPDASTVLQSTRDGYVGGPPEGPGETMTRTHKLILLQHVTFSINSICHLWGRCRFASRDESRNVWWLSWLSFGESWHNNHHAFPSSAFHGLRRTEIDPGGWLILLLERVGLAWNVVRIPPDKQARKLAL